MAWPTASKSSFLAHFADYEGFRAELKRKASIAWACFVDEPFCWPSLLWQTYDYYLEPTAATSPAKTFVSRCTFNGIASPTTSKW